MLTFIDGQPNKHTAHATCLDVRSVWSFLVLGVQTPAFCSDWQLADALAGLFLLVLRTYEVCVVS